MFEKEIFVFVKRIFYYFVLKHNVLYAGSISSRMTEQYTGFTCLYFHATNTFYAQPRLVFSGQGYLSLPELVLENGSPPY